MNKAFIDFEGRLIVLSGATGGLGREIAGQLASLNARLLLLGRDEQRLQQLADSLQGDGHSIACVDLAAPEKLEAELKPLLKSLGDVYGLCHCAGVVAFRPLNTTKPEVLHDIMNINVYSGLELARLISNKTIAKKNDGSIVLISSVCADSGSPGQAAYCASKGALNSLMRTMAVEMAARNIRVNSISPGVVRTEMTETKSGLSSAQIDTMLERYPLANGRPEDVARATAFLLAPENQWITGVDLKVDGGFSAQ